MAKLKWSAYGQRTFHTGVDRVVIYPHGMAAAVWNGAVSINRKRTNGQIVSRYYDTHKYGDYEGSEDYEAELTAFSSPEEFDLCDGSSLIQSDVRLSFGMCYRSLLGNDTEGDAHGYTLNLVYQAKAFPRDITRSTVNSTVIPNNFVWDIRAKPVNVRRAKDTAFVSIDSRDTPSNVLILLEEYLYGTSTQDPRLPSPNELMALFGLRRSGYGHGPYGHGPYGHGPSRI